MFCRNAPDNLRFVIHHAAVAAVAALGAASSLAAVSPAAADPAGNVPLCRTVRASGGDYNGGGGTMYAEVKIKNLASRPCMISGRPWIELPQLPHPVRVEDWTGDFSQASPAGT
jgi:hypothetical protein